MKRIRYNAARKPGGDAKPEEPGGDAEQEDHAEHAGRGQDGGKLKAPRGNTLKEDKNWAPPNSEVEPTTSHRRLRSQSKVIPNDPLPRTYVPESPPACQPDSESPGLLVNKDSSERHCEGKKETTERTVVYEGPDQAFISFSANIFIHSKPED